MVALPIFAEPDPTLAASDAALVELSKREKRRNYLGMSIIGHECSRRLWYDYHTDRREVFSSETLKRFADGHASEDVMAQRLRLVPGVTLMTVDPATGRQWEVSDFDGRFAGHMDGIIIGLLQAPRVRHVWEGKAVQEKSLTRFRALKDRLGEKNALAEWNPTYYAQAQCYMGYGGITRHYITVATPGVRDWDSARTEFDPETFAAIKDKARRILSAKVPLARLSEKPDWWACKFCHHRPVCHNLQEEQP